jgi:hypothetical protein
MFQLRSTWSLRYNDKRPTIKRVLHLLRDSQNLLASMQALVVLVTRVADLPVRVPLNPLIEVIYRVAYDLRLQSVKFNHRFQGRTVERTAAFTTLPKSLLLLLFKLSWSRTSSFSSCVTVRFERLRFVEEPRPVVGIVLEGRISAT